MYQADALTIEAGTSSISLMDAAGRAVAQVCETRWPKSPVVILCGPGNNGGDGFVAARYLKQAGWTVRLHCLVAHESLTGDAAHHANLWTDSCDGDILEFDTITLKDSPIVIDAIFGAGLARSIEGDLAELFERINTLAAGCLSVDLPSGISGDSGEILGTSLQADCTVTFFCKKPGHLLQPSANLCGDITVADIGTPHDVLNTIKPSLCQNDPQVWLTSFPPPASADHKFTRGHALIYGGDKMMGAARLAARAARRVGAGLSSIICTRESFEIYAKADPGTIVEEANKLSDFQELLTDDRRNVVAIGPGAGLNERTKDFTITALNSGKPVVLDADALSVFAENPDNLFKHLNPTCILTPHEGEFARLFNISGNKLDRTRQASKICNAIVVLKGSDTVIAAPDGRATINNNAPPDLATAGAGDVLVGIIAGLLAQRQDETISTFEAACAGVWIHGKCASLVGAGLIAEDLCEKLPDVLKELRPDYE